MIMLIAILHTLLLSISSSAFETKNTTRLKQVVSTLRGARRYFLNAGAPLYYGDEVIAILEEVIKSDNGQSKSCQAKSSSRLFLGAIQNKSSY